MKKIEKLIKKQLAYEFATKEEDLDHEGNIFTLKKSDHKFMTNNQVSTNIIIYKDKLLIRSDDESLLKDLEKDYRAYPGQWFTEAKNIYKLRATISGHGLKIRNIYPSYAPCFVEKTEDERFFWIKSDDFKDYKKDRKYDFVFSYEKGEIGLGFKDEGKIIALVSAIREGEYFYDIGLEKYCFDDKYKKLGSSMLEYLTYNLIKNTDRIPLASTQFSHSKSINLMVNAGYRYAFTNISID